MCKSEVEKNQTLICVWDILIYSDVQNFEKYKVVELTDTWFIAEDNQKNRQEYNFDSLQYGWTISEKTKEYHKLNNKFIYK